jgi:hypothetical protein
LPPQRCHVKGQRGEEMRDIRNDLQERADLVQDRIKAANAHFERMVEQLRSEHDARVADLKSALSMIEKLMEFENGNVVPLENPSARTASLADRIKAAG